MVINGIKNEVMNVTKMDIDKISIPRYWKKFIFGTNVERLVESIRKRKFYPPLVVNKNNGNILCGVDLYFALKDLGYTNVFITPIDISYDQQLSIYNCCTVF